MAIQPIPTRYNGVLYRSRLEARWRVFFDEMCIAVEYEPEGFDMDGVRYLPDFWLPDVRMFAEVKPGWLSDTERHKARLLAMMSGRPVLLLDGEPSFKPYSAFFGVILDEKPDECALWEFDLDIYHGRNYYLSEGRFFSDPGHREWEEFSPEYQGAVSAALTARFEAA